MKEEGGITFFDESVLSGKQASTVVQIWFGLDPLDLAKERDLSDSLTQEVRNSLRKRRVRFRFLYGLKDGMDHLGSVTQSVNLGNDIVAFSEESGWTKSFGSLPDQEQLAPLQDFLARVGHQLLASTKHTNDPESWPDTRCKDFALGYGGLKQLVVFSYNTPTATLTPLWKAGRFRDSDWLPLFPRRGEKSPAVVHEG